jgi:hypothetical protein
LKWPTAGQAVMKVQDLDRARVSLLAERKL